ncbi:unnamed protein product, partial [Penicillium viridicatum]
MASTNSSIQNEPTPNPFDPDALIILSIPCIPCLEQQLGSWHMDSAFWPIRCHHYQANERQYLANYAVPPGCAHMVCELLGLVRYANLFWQNTGPAYEPELLYVIGLAVQTLVCDFVDAVYIHRSGWRIFGNSMTM